MTSTSTLSFFCATHDGLEREMVERVMTVARLAHPAGVLRVKVTITSDAPESGMAVVAPAVTPTVTPTVTPKVTKKRGKSTSPIAPAGPVVGGGGVAGGGVKKVRSKAAERTAKYRAMDKARGKGRSAKGALEVDEEEVAAIGRALVEVKAGLLDGSLCMTEAELGMSVDEVATARVRAMRAGGTERAGAGGTESAGAGGTESAGAGGTGSTGEGGGMESTEEDSTEEERGELASMVGGCGTVDMSLGALIGGSEEEERGKLAGRIVGALVGAGAGAGTGAGTGAEYCAGVVIDEDSPTGTWWRCLQAALEAYEGSAMEEGMKRSYLLTLCQNVFPGLKGRLNKDFSERRLVEAVGFAVGSSEDGEIGVEAFKESIVGVLL